MSQQNTSEQPIDIILITGFLGAGKTTLINHLLSGAMGNGAGLLVNDFGDVVVDGGLVRSGRSDNADGADALEIYEVSGGSIFCSCKTANFAMGLRMFARVRPKRLFVEASGMSDPSGFEKLLAEYRLAADFTISRIVCLADALRTAKMLDNIPALSRQLESADLILINKSDLADEQSLSAFESRLRDINPEARIERTIRADIDSALLVGSGSAHRRGDIVSCNTPSNRPGTLQLNPAGQTRDSLDAFLHDQLSDTWRIKGWVELEGRWWYISDNAGSLEWTEGKLPSGQNPGITVITPPGGDQAVADAWREFSSRKAG